MKKATLTTLNLEGWFQNICELMNHFLSLHFLHVYREYNKREDSLSKEVFSMAVVFFIFTEFYEGEIIGNGSLQLF